MDFSRDSDYFEITEVYRIYVSMPYKHEFFISIDKTLFFPYYYYTFFVFHTLIVMGKILQNILQIKCLFRCSRYRRIDWYTRIWHKDACNIQMDFFQHCIKTRSCLGFFLVIFIYFFKQEASIKVSKYREVTKKCSIWKWMFLVLSKKTRTCFRKYVLN